MGTQLSRLELALLNRLGRDAMSAPGGLDLDDQRRLGAVAVRAWTELSADAGDRHTEVEATSRPPVDPPGEAEAAAPTSSETGGGSWAERVEEARGAGVTLRHVTCPRCSHPRAEEYGTVDGWAIICTEGCGYHDAPW